MSKTRMTVGQAIVKFLNQQYIEFDGVEEPFVDGIFTIFGHGMVVGLGQALEEDPGHLRVYQGRNEQGMAHAAISYAKQHNRRKIIACSSSIGVGAANMVTAALTATINNLPLLLFPSDSFATRQPDPVLQQLEVPGDLSMTASDCFKPVAKYWDRISRPEQLMTAMVNAMRVLTDTANCGTAVISMPQDVQGESFDFPDYFFQKRVHHIARRVADDYEIDQAVRLIQSSKKPMVIAGGGVRYSEAGQTVMDFCKAFRIPVSQTQAGHSCLPDSFELAVGGIGVSGGLAANTLCKDCDLVIGVGTRFNDFVTGSKWVLFRNPDIKVLPSTPLSSTPRSWTPPAAWATPRLRSRPSRRNCRRPAISRATRARSTRCAASGRPSAGACWACSTTARASARASSCPACPAGPSRS